MSISTWDGRASSALLFRSEDDWRQAAAGTSMVFASTTGSTTGWQGWVPASIWFALRGSVVVTAAGADVVVDAGALFVVEHGARIAVRTRRASDGVGAVLLDDAMVAARFTREFAREAEMPIVLPERIDEAPSIYGALLRLAWQAESGDRLDAAHDELLANALGDVLRRQACHEPEIDRCPGRSEGYRRRFFMQLQRARNAIEASRGTQSSLEQLARIADMSPTHFLRSYRHVFGTTPHKHAVDLRFAYARDLLTQTREPVKAICRAVGLQSCAAFARAFRAYHGVSPREVRAGATHAPTIHAPASMRAWKPARDAAFS